MRIAWVNLKLNLSLKIKSRKLQATSLHFYLSRNCSCKSIIPNRSKVNPGPKQVDAQSISPKFKTAYKRACNFRFSTTRNKKERGEKTRLHRGELVLEEKDSEVSSVTLLARVAVRLDRVNAENQNAVAEMSETRGLLSLERGCGATGLERRDAR